jgi:prepilin-type N-terminal cleavage/methylation domain-containing protein
MPAFGMRRGFTLIELLVAIGVLALVSIGLAVIFGAIGETVSEGRRASTLNRAGERIESQLRADIERLTRDGYLVIAQRYASEEPVGGGEPPVIDDLKLSPRDATGRVRRADEIMFFARGDFVSRRAPLASGVLATANEAAIYYGIGQKRVPDLETRLNNPQNFFFNPFPTDSNLESTSRRPYAPLLGVQEPPGAPANPNRYAQDWSLLRQVTLLTTPNIVSQTPGEVFGIERDTEINNGTRLLQDSLRQIALQPASRSLFSSLSWTDIAAYNSPPGTPTSSGPYADGESRWWIGDVARFPSAISSPAFRSLPAWRSSGVVDIAQTRIADVRRMIRSLAAIDRFPSDYYPPQSVRPFNPRPASGPQSFDAFNSVWLDPATNPSSDPTPASAGTLNVITDGPALRAWALDSMPSLWDTSSPVPRYLAGVRYEDTPTRLVYEEEEFADTDDGRLARAIAEANQEMLTSQVFVPRVTEFIVEWSYGTVDTTLTPGDAAFRQMQWFGIPRATRDDNRDGVIDLTDHAADPTVRRYTDPLFSTPELQGDPSRDPGRVMVNRNIADQEESPDFAVFGFTDPVGTANANNDVVIDWPRFLRFTITIADPEDQETERTFQFVFAVPGEQG